MLSSQNLYLTSLINVPSTQHHGLCLPASAVANRSRLRKKGHFAAILLRDDVLRSCCVIDDVFSISCAIARVSIASFVLASLARSVKFYDLGRLGAGRGEHVVLRRQQKQLVGHQLRGREDTARTTVAG